MGPRESRFDSYHSDDAGMRREDGGDPSVPLVAPATWKIDGAVTCWLAKPRPGNTDAGSIPASSSKGTCSDGNLYMSPHALQIWDLICLVSREAGFDPWVRLHTAVARMDGQLATNQEDGGSSPSSRTLQASPGD